MANDLVVRLGAKLDQFQSDMNQAGSIADDAVSKIENSFSSLNPNFGSIGTALATGLGGAAAAAIALLGFLHNVNSELAEIAKNAEFVGVSTARFQELRFGATQSGVSGDQATADLRKLAGLLADAKENENSLTKILDTNNVKYRDRYGDIVKIDEMLKIIASTINKFDSFPEKVKAAEMLGLSEAWVRALRENGKQFEQIAASAEDAGVVIDRSTIAKAEIFDTEWKKSSDRLSGQFKSVLADIAVGLDGLIEQASKAITEFNKARGISEGSGQVKANKYFDWLLNYFFPELKVAATDAEKLSAALGGGSVPLPASRPAGADRPTPGAFKLPSRAGPEEDDSFDRESERIQRHTEQIRADTIATFLNHGAQAELRAEFQLLNAIRKDEGEVTDKQIEKYTELRATMSAQQALTRSGIELTKEHSDAFFKLSESAGAATTQLNKSQEQLQKINSASSQLGSALSTAFADAIVEGKSLNEVFASLIKTLEKAAINAAFASIFNPTASGGTSLFAGLFTGHAEGTNYATGGWSWVGEKGPELVNLPRGSQVIPNSVAAGGGAPIIYSPSIDARGASVEAVSHLARVMAEQQQSFARNVVEVVRKARSGRHL